MPDAPQSPVNLQHGVDLQNSTNELKKLQLGDNPADPAELSPRTKVTDGDEPIEDIFQLNLDNNHYSEPNSKHDENDIGNGNDNDDNNDSDNDEYDEESPLGYTGEEEIIQQGDELENATFDLHSLHRKLTKDDAESIVGGESYNELSSATGLSSQQSTLITGASSRSSTTTSAKTDYSLSSLSGRFNFLNNSQKVFSFSLPFGGSIERLYKQIHTHIPLIRVGSEDSTNNTNVEMKTTLERHQSLSTLDEDKLFEGYKGRGDESRMKAIKQTITSSLLPDIINNSVLNSSPLGSNYETIYNRIEGNIVILGGYRGSILRDSKTHKRVWIPIKAGFNLRKINLLLGPTKEDEINAVDYMYPDGILKNIGPIDICKKLIKRLSSNPKVNVQEFGYDWRLGGELIAIQMVKFLQKIYDETGKPSIVIAHSMGGLMATSAMQKNPSLFRGLIYVGSPSECLNILGPIRFGDSVLLSDKILTFESNFMMRSSFNFLPLSGKVFYDKFTNEPIILDLFDPDTWVEYNLNPLVSKKRKLADETSHTILSAVPMDNGGGSSIQPVLSNESSLQFPTISSIGNKIRTISTSSFKRKHTDDSLNSPPQSQLQRGRDILSSYMSSKRSSSASSRNSDTDNALTKTESTDLYIEENISYHFTFKEAYNYLKETLISTKEFILSLDFNPELEDKYPPMAVVYGNKVPSVRGSKVNGIQDIKDGNYYNFFYGYGDGVVHQKWLMPQGKGYDFYNPNTGKGQIVGKYPSDCGHVSLMTDFKAMGQALNAIHEADKVWKYRKMIKHKEKSA
ncbi:uncharacterized protein RJT21DRAFT_119220 [Scheffersomyces amazonensis]|uniref:uncharacterized protein n=1 Tax=Scheffersomyces amazonensis TaxID=1078765 RepID=UPI00315C73A9